MKRINENTIIVTLFSDDLAKHGVTMLDLLGNQEQIEDFFYEILTEVDTDNTFAKSDAVTFQVMPKGEGLELLISNNAPNFNPTNLEQINQENLADFSESQNNVESDAKLDFHSKLTRSELKADFRFDDFEDVIALSQSLKASGLYSKLSEYNGKYYLSLEFLDDNFVELSANDAWMIANDFGQREYSADISWKTKGKTIFDHDALENLRYYFK